MNVESEIRQEEPKLAVDVSSIRSDLTDDSEQTGELPISIEVNDLSLFYGEAQALNEINLRVPQKKVTAFIGPSGCGKSTLLRCFNRMNDLINTVRITGKINLLGEDIFDPAVNVALLRRRVGMVFQKPNPFPKSIYDNVAYGLRIQGSYSKKFLDEAVEKAL